MKLFRSSVTAASFPPPPTSPPKSIVSAFPPIPFSIFDSPSPESLQATADVLRKLLKTRRETWTTPSRNHPDPAASNSHHLSISQVLHAPVPSPSNIDAIAPIHYRFEVREDELAKTEEQRWNRTKELSDRSSSEQSSPRSSLASEESFDDIATLVDYYFDGGDSTAEESEDQDVYDKQMKIWDETLWVVRGSTVSEQEIVSKE